MNPDSEPLFRPPQGALPPEEPRIIAWREPEVVSNGGLRWLVKVVLVGVLIIGVLTGAAFSMKPVYRKVKLWRSEPIANESLALSEQGKAREARCKAEVAFRLAPGTPLATRALAVALTNEGNLADARRLFELLIQSGFATDVDQCGLVDTMLRLGDFRAAEQRLAILGVPVQAIDGSGGGLSERPDSSTPRAPSERLLALASTLYLKQNELEKASFFAREAVRIAPDNPEAQIVLGASELRSLDTHSQGFARLQKIADPGTGANVNGARNSLRALSILSEAPFAHFAELGWVAEHLNTHPVATNRHRLRALKLKCQAYPERADTLLTKVLAEYASSIDSTLSGQALPEGRAVGLNTPSTKTVSKIAPEEVSAFCGVLMALGKAEQVLELLPKDRAFRRRDWYILHLDALAAEKRWIEIIQLLEGQKKTSPLPSALVTMYIGRCWYELGYLIKAEAIWQNALSEAKSRPELLSYYANYAENLGYKEQAKEGTRVDSLGSLTFPA